MSKAHPYQWISQDLVLQKERRPMSRMEGTAEEQNTILNEIQALGYNVVECPVCTGVELLVRIDEAIDTYKCFICDEEFDSSDCSDMVFPDKNNHGYFANTWIRFTSGEVDDFINQSILSANRRKDR